MDDLADPVTVKVAQFVVEILAVRASAGAGSEVIKQASIALRSLSLTPLSKSFKLRPGQEVLLETLLRGHDKAAEVAPVLDIIPTLPLLARIRAKHLQQVPMENPRGTLPSNEKHQSRERLQSKRFNDL